MSTVTGPSGKQVSKFIKQLDRLPPDVDHRVQVTSCLPSGESRVFIGNAVGYFLTSYISEQNIGRLDFLSCQMELSDGLVSANPEKMFFYTKEYSEPTHIIWVNVFDRENVPHDGWITDIRRVMPIAQQVGEALPCLPPVLTNIVAEYVDGELIQTGPITEPPRTPSQECLQSVVGCAKSVAKCAASICKTLASFCI